MKTIDVCLSPDMMHLYDLNGRTVVVVDILRATSCMVTAFAHGVDHIVPVAELEACLAMKSLGYITSGERNGEKVPGFDKGNSPFEYMEDVAGKKIAFTTTNGTQAIEKSKGAARILIGSFLNLGAVARYLVEKQDNNVLVVCAAWKGKVNLEDTLFAGALVKAVKSIIMPDCDAPLAAEHLYEQGKGDLVKFLGNASHVKRLNKLNIHEDIAYCVTLDKYDVVPVLVGSELRS